MVTTLANTGTRFSQSDTVPANTADQTGVNPRERRYDSYYLGGDCGGVSPRQTGRGRSQVLVITVLR